MFDFANILLSGPCNLSCPHCIGRRPGLQHLPDNLHEFPPAGLETLIDLVNRHGIRQVSITGTNTDPQLYQYEEQLISLLRLCTGDEIQLSLHTNGHLILEKPGIFNRYDRAALSFPSFRSETCRKMTGSSKVPDLEKIVAISRIPLKVSIILTDHNSGELDELLQGFHKLGIQRVVLRKPYGDHTARNPFLHLTPARHFLENPVYDWQGLEVTFWEFETTMASCLNLYSTGEISDSYLLEGRSHCGKSNLCYK